jgi:hypothetical protein
LTEAVPPLAVIREAVASFPDREHFRQAASALLAAGFVASDLSVLATHHPLTDVSSEAEQESVPTDLGGEIKFVGPLTAAGIVILSGGPIAAVVAALVAAGLGLAAFKEFFDNYIAAPHRDEFTEALETGVALLWVRCADPDIELAATRILEEAGGRHVHVHARSPLVGN